jgi:hypothetical protein
MVKARFFGIRVPPPSVGCTSGVDRRLKDRANRPYNSAILSQYSRNILRLQPSCDAEEMK